MKRRNNSYKINNSYKRKIYRLEVKLSRLKILLKKFQPKLIVLHLMLIKRKRKWDNN